MKGGQIVAQGVPKDVITQDILDHLYGIQCDLLEDPHTGAPILLNVRRSHTPMQRCHQAEVAKTQTVGERQGHMTHA